MGTPDLVNAPELPDDLEQAGCLWIYRGDHSTSGLWSLQVGPYNKSPLLGAVQHQQQRKGRWVGFTITLHNPLSVLARAHQPARVWRSREQAVAVLLKHARAMLLKLTRQQILGAGDG